MSSHWGSETYNLKKKKVILEPLVQLSMKIVLILGLGSTVQVYDSFCGSRILVVALKPVVWLYTPQWTSGILCKTVQSCLRRF